MNERRAIPGFATRYTVTQDGRVYTVRGNEIRQSTKCGKQRVQLYPDNGKSKTSRTIERLLEEVWGLESALAYCAKQMLVRDDGVYREMCRGDIHSTPRQIE